MDVDDDESVRAGVAGMLAQRGRIDGLEVAPFGIQVTLVEPGSISTDFTASRRTSATATGPLYGSAFTKAIGVMEHDEANGAPAAAVATVVRRALEAPHPPRRVSAGKAAERMGLLAKRLLPFRVFQATAKGALGV